MKANRSFIDDFTQLTADIVYTILDAKKEMDQLMHDNAHALIGNVDQYAQEQFKAISQLAKQIDKEVTDFQKQCQKQWDSFSRDFNPEAFFSFPGSGQAASSKAAGEKKSGSQPSVKTARPGRPKKAAAKAAPKAAPNSAKKSAKKTASLPKAKAAKTAKAPKSPERKTAGRKPGRPRKAETQAATASAPAKRQSAAPVASGGQAARPQYQAQATQQYNVARPKPYASELAIKDALSQVSKESDRQPAAVSQSNISALKPAQPSTPLATGSGSASGGASVGGSKPAASANSSPSSNAPVVKKAE